MTKIQDRKLFLGIDPSFTNLGLCLYDPEAGTMQLFTGDFMEALGWINRTVNLSQVIAVLENPALDKPTFVYGMVKKTLLEFQTYSRWLAKKNGFPPKKVGVEDVLRQMSISMKFAQNVGENKAAAKLLKKLFRDKRVPTIEIRPSKRQRADKLPKVGKVKVDIRTLTMPTKTNQTQFKELTGYEDPSSEHARDAATLVWGRTLRSAYLHFARIAEAEGEEDPDLLYIIKGRAPKKEKRKLPF
jgi:hypothetical protein